MAYIGNDVDAVFIPGSVNTSTDLTITGGSLTQTGGDVNLDSGTLFLDEDVNRVGIGTTSPTVELDVIGTIRATTYADLPTSVTVLSRGGEGIIINAPTATLTCLDRNGMEVEVTF